MEIMKDIFVVLSIINFGLIVVVVLSKLLNNLRIWYLKVRGFIKD
jgi:hypothetical protein